MAAPAPAPTKHSFQFFRAGGVDQVVFRNGSDIAHLDQLDLKLWVALACPVAGLEFEPRTLKFLDTDGDGRIRAGEVLTAVRWLREALKSLDELTKESDSLPLAALNEKTPAGAALLAGAKRILKNLGKADATAITLDDVASTERIFAGTRFNGDGVIPVDAAGDDATRRVLEDVIAMIGSTPDRSGKPGVGREQVDLFFSQAAAWSEWRARAEQDKTIAPLGPKTAEAAAATAAVAAKVDDWFTRCALAAFDPRAAGLLNGAEADFAALAPRELTERHEEIARLPLARVEAGRALPLGEGINPAWAARIAAFRDQAVTPLLGKGRTSLSDADWAVLRAKLAPFEAWTAARPATQVEKLGHDRVRELLAGKVHQTILGLIEQDAALAPENARINDVEKLLLYRRDLYRLLNNFVNFSEFYSRKGAVFQAGTLYLDGRSCDLCVRVPDPGKHAALAGLAKTYLAYCDCTRPGGEKMTVAVAFTGGDSDHLMAGRNGVFYDRQGRDWDATIAKVVDNPISIRQAFWSPYKRFVRLVEEQVAKRAATAEGAHTARMQATAEQMAHVDRPTVAGPPAPAPAPAPAAAAAPAPAPAKKVDVGAVAAISVAIAGIATFLSSVMATFLGLGPWLPLGILALVLGISVPSVLIAWLKLRQRNLGPILDANGWAVNGRVRVNVPFGGALTTVAALPPGSKRSMTDPYAEKRRPWGLYLTLLLILALAGTWYFEKLDRWLPVQVQARNVLGKLAPSRWMGEQKPAVPEPGPEKPK